MSKKNRLLRAMQNSSNTSPSASAEAAHAQEYAIIKHDLVRLLIINTVFLVGILVVYFTNQNSHYLERWFERVFGM